MHDQQTSLPIDEEREIYADELYAIIERASHENKNNHQRFTRYVPSKGNFVLVMPYKRIKGRYYYLMERNWVPGWDMHPDLCAISGPAIEEPSQAAQHLFKQVTKIEFNAQAFVPLGAASASRWSGDTFYLFGLDVTGIHETIQGENLSWLEEEDLMQTLDSQAIVAISRLKLVP